jgi:uncharacterized membrane protein YvbJ
MFCPFCGRQNKDNAAFCVFCNRALPQKNSAAPINQTFSQVNDASQKEQKSKISFNSLKAIVTGVLIVGMVILIIQLYYPSVLPWNW